MDPFRAGREGEDDIWTSLSSKFTLPTLATAAEIEALKLKVKKWSLKKIAQQFNNHKKSYTITISRRRHL
jgi:hypothetical protein